MTESTKDKYLRELYAQREFLLKQFNCLVDSGYDERPFFIECLPGCFAINPRKSFQVGQ